jgi:hypothetical protein
VSRDPELAKACSTLDRIIDEIDNADPLRRVFLIDQTRETASRWWARMVEEEYGGLDPFPVTPEVVP